MSELALPTARDEEWRYADFSALKTLAPEEFGRWKDLELAPGETRRKCLILDGASPELHRVRLTVGEGARAELFAVNAGGDYLRLEVVVRLAKGAHFEFGGVTIGGGDVTREFVTRVEHAEPDATSHQVVRSVHWGQATGNFLGRIEVARDAQKTDAAQDFKGLILERGASTNAKPKPARSADDRRIMQHDTNRMHYQPTRFEKYFPPPNETAGGALGRHIGDVLKKIAKSVCDPNKRSTASNMLCAVPPLPPSPMDHDERLNLPASPLAGSFCFARLLT